MSHVVVVGSGVIGLSVAFELVSNAALRPTSLCIIGQHFPRDEPVSHEFTSPWAGAHFRPFPHRPESYKSDQRESRYTRDTYRALKHVARYHPESSVEFMKGVDLLEDPSPEYACEGPGFNADSLDAFRRLCDSELPKDVKMGFEYDTFCLNAPVYLTFLQDRVRDLCQHFNVKFELKRMTLSSLQEAFHIYPQTTALFNCSGNGLQLDGKQDPACFPIRGQTLLVDVPHDTAYAHKTVTHQARDGNWTFVIKRPAPYGKRSSQYIVGGTKQIGDATVVARESDSNAILQRASVLFPELMVDGQFSVKRVNVGFRPARYGGSRVELERTDQGPVVVHCYGFGGMGFETSLGAALDALRVYQKAIRPNRAKL
ncbi:LAMI_0F12398g1_1 [Lachancea mirantina]|uniref:LAMI_0F12398g1_1 n=1 Tax=Lachancea mirantina TaxID=1230905 RepID=A0A1G4K2V8_9SACH|nr:LAMI_0F12398g1_1 [Lachancea mirantina]